MQLRISINLHNQPLELPLAHHHILASVYYRLMGPEESVLHDIGKTYGKRNYRLFTFGPISGKYIVNRDRKRIRFVDRIEMEFRSVNREMILAMASNALTNGVTFGETTYTDVHCDISNPGIKSNCIEVSMISPICAHKTRKICERKTFRKKRRTQYFTPQDKRFFGAVSENCSRKYYAATGRMLDSQLTIEAVNVDARDKYLTRYKDNTIEAYKGTYRLQGSAELLLFLFNVGLGEKNSQGFGMFQVRGEN